MERAGQGRAAVAALDARPALYDIRDIPLAARSVAQVPVPSAAGFDRAYVAPARPVVLRGLGGQWPAMSRVSLDRLRRDFPHAPITVARLDEGRVVMDPREGLLFERPP